MKAVPAAPHVDRLSNGLLAQSSRYRQSMIYRSIP